MVLGSNIGAFTTREAVRVALLLLVGWSAVEAAGRGYAALGRVAMEPWGPGLIAAPVLAVLFAVLAVARWEAPGQSAAPARLVLGAQALVPAALLLSAPVLAGSSPGWAHRLVLGGGWWLAALWLGTVLYRLATTPRQPDAGRAGQPAAHR